MGLFGAVYILPLYFALVLLFAPQRSGTLAVSLAVLGLAFASEATESLSLSLSLHSPMRRLAAPSNGRADGATLGQGYCPFEHRLWVGAQEFEEKCARGWHFERNTKLGLQFVF